MNTIGYFEIQASDPQKAATFYKNVFDWDFKRDELIPLEYYRMTSISGIMGAILKRSAHIPPTECGTNAFTCSIEVKDFDEVSQKILQSGGQVALPKFAVPGRCWQGYFIDIDNNVFGLFQADEKAQ